jgi:ubiquitin C-terminal hydrolase
MNNYNTNNNYTNNSTINNYNTELLPVGLENIGLICYMNSALQCLVNIPSLSNYFLEKKYEINEDNQILSHAYLQIVENVLRKTPESQTITTYCPIEFRDIAEINPLFRSAADSIDLINYFLATVHKELNQMTDEVILVKYFINNPNNEKQQKLNKLITDFISQNNSIITNIFYFIEKSKISCMNCNAIFYNFQVMNYLIFPLEEIRRYNFQTFGVNRNYVKLLEGFNYYKKIGPMLGQFYCNNCHLQSTALQCNTLYSLPEILIINLNRGRGNIFKVGIEFPEILNLSNEVESKIYNCSNYKLIGVITHFGESGTSGHFIAFCFVQEKNKWYKFNDSIVSESNFQDASTIGDTYILFYQRK